jgi:hypothetical protein
MNRSYRPYHTPSYPTLQYPSCRTPYRYRTRPGGNICRLSTTRKYTLRTVPLQFALLVHNL